MRSIRRPWLFYGSALLVAGALAWFVPGVWNLDNGEVTVTQWHRSKGEVQVNVGPNQSSWIDAKSISKNVLNAFVVAEDARFYQHKGLDFDEIEASLRLNLRKGRYARGASTITQQVVKMACLSREKSILRKAREAVGALLLERILSKEQILEWYINLAEFGDGVYGIKQASWHYFHTKPELLTIQQAAHLALVLPSPNGWSVGLRRRDLTDFGHRRFATIVNRMKVSGYITEDQWLNALATGNFGRPVFSYNEILSKHRRDEGLSSEDLEMSEEEIPLGIPFNRSDDKESPGQTSRENHGKNLINELIQNDDQRKYPSNSSNDPNFTKKHSRKETDHEDSANEPQIHTDEQQPKFKPAARLKTKLED